MHTKTDAKPNTKRSSRRKATRDPATCRTATLDQIIISMLAVHFCPVPCKATVRSWFDKAGIPRFKSNPTAKRGGGDVFYSVPHVEKFLKSRTLRR